MRRDLRGSTRTAGTGDVDRDEAQPARASLSVI